MTYTQTLDWLFSQLPMYQRTSGANYKIDLQKTHEMLDALGHPEKGMNYIHVAGTNGKGSTSHMVASVLQEAGYKTGLYTSPHLIDFRERIKLNGVEISQDFVVDFVAKHHSTFVELELSFFEMTVGLAFAYFKSQNTEAVVLEVGMGGRLDSTNVVTPIVSVITNIGLDHQAFLGDTLAKIAAEKAGIIKPNTSVIIGEKQSEIAHIFKTVADENNAPLTFATPRDAENYTTDLKGNYQQKNLATAVCALRQQNYFKVSEEALKKGLNNVVKNTGLLGRWQTLQNQPLLICDTGHNTEGVKELIAQIKSTPHKTLHLVWGMVNDKNVTDVLQLLPKSAQFYFTQASIPRALNVEVLAQEALSIGMKGEKFTTVKAAVDFAQKRAHPNDLIFVGGSTFVVADLLEAWKRFN